MTYSQIACTAAIKMRQAAPGTTLGPFHIYLLTHLTSNRKFVGQSYDPDACL